MLFSMLHPVLRKNVRDDIYPVMQGNYRTTHRLVGHPQLTQYELPGVPSIADSTAMVPPSPI